MKKLIILIFLSIIGLAEDKPNIIWIYVDDQGPQWSSYGNKLVTTPNLDALAKDGVLFTNAFSASPVCSTSHTSLFTGNHVTYLTCPHHRSDYIDELPKGVFHTEELLSNAGYLTVNMISNGTGKDRILHGASGKTDLNFMRKSEKNKKMASVGQSGAEVFDNVHKFDNDKLDTYFSGGVWDQRKKKQPFFCYINIETGKAHGFKYGTTWAKENKIAIKASKVTPPPYFPQDTYFKQYWASIYDSVSYTDHVVGNFIKALKSKGLYDNSLIMIAGDHGFAVLRHKHTLYDSGLRVPLIIKYPKNINAGSTSNRMTSLIDIAPTSLKCAQIAIPATMLGKDVSLPQKYIYGTRDGVDGTFDRYRCIRSNKYKLILHFYPEIPYINGGYAKGRLFHKKFKEMYKSKKLNATQLLFLNEEKLSSVELYDLEKDPYEINNLADDNNFSKIRQGLLNDLKIWMTKNNDNAPDYHKLFPNKKVPKDYSIKNILKKYKSKQRK